MHGLFEDASDLLRERPVFGGRAAAEGFLQVVRNVCADKNSFAISHLSASLLCQILTLQMRNRSVSRILYFD